jgi:hypothetical protein
MIRAQPTDILLPIGSELCMHPREGSSCLSFLRSSTGEVVLSKVYEISPENRKAAFTKSGVVSLATYPALSADSRFYIAIYHRLNDNCSVVAIGGNSIEYSRYM